MSTLREKASITRVHPSIYRRDVLTTLERFDVALPNTYNILRKSHKSPIRCARDVCTDVKCWKATR